VTQRSKHASVRALPARANLEHLKNEAKKLHRELLKKDPAVALAAAQLEIARRYGFASWRKLKSYVDALQEFGSDLIEAVRAGDAAKVGLILDRHPDLANAAADLDAHVLRPSDALAMRLVHLAVAEDRGAVLRLLIERGAHLNVRNADGRLPLHDCFELARDGLAELLLAAGAGPDACYAAACGMHEKLIERLEQSPAEANDLQTGLTPLGWCGYGNDQTRSAEILLERGAIVDRPPYDRAAWGPVSHVANLPIARVLLAHGADPNAKLQNGDTPLHAVVKSRLVGDASAFVELLLAGGADSAIRNEAGRTALDEALEQAGAMAETYFPARPLRQKEMRRTIALLGG
jgi:hypothetical protein